MNEKAEDDDGVDWITEDGPSVWFDNKRRIKRILGFCLFIACILVGEYLYLEGYLTEQQPKRYLTSEFIRTEYVNRKPLNIVMYNDDQVTVRDTCKYLITYRFQIVARNPLPTWNMESIYGGWQEVFPVEIDSFAYSIEVLHAPTSQPKLLEDIYIDH